MFPSIRTMLAFFAACNLSACATDRTFGTAPDIQVTQLDSLPAPKSEIYYTIGGQEELEVYVVGSDLLSGTYLTDENGKITFPLLGEVDLAGQAPGAAALRIADGLRGRYILNPQVRVIPKQIPQPSISVGGQVERPGLYPAQGQQTLLRMINQAGGLDPYAKLDDVLVMRTVEGQKYIGLYNLGAIQRGNYSDPELYPNDIVMVGDSPARRRIDSFLQFAPVLTSALIVVDQLRR